MTGEEIIRRVIKILAVYNLCEELPPIHSIDHAVVEREGKVHDRADCHSVIINDNNFFGDCADTENGHFKLIDGWSPRHPKVGHGDRSLYLVGLYQKGPQLREQSLLEKSNRRTA